MTAVCRAGLSPPIPMRTIEDVGYCDQLMFIECYDEEIGRCGCSAGTDDVMRCKIKEAVVKLQRWLMNLPEDIASVGIAVEHKGRVLHVDLVRRPSSIGVAAQPLERDESTDPYGLHDVMFHGMS